MFTLTKINLLWEKVKALTKKVDDNEIPSHAAADAGKYLGVDASGELEFSNVPMDVLKVNVGASVSSDKQSAILNAYMSGKIVYITSGAYLYNVTGIEFMSEGGLLSVTAISVAGDGKMRRFYASESGSWVPVITENPNIVNYSETEQDTGIKWIDNREIYQRTIVLDESILVKNTWISTGIESTGIAMVLAMEIIDNNNNPLSGVSLALIDGYIALMSYTSTGLNVKTFTIRYTKTAPAADTETRKKKTTKVKEED